MSDIAVRVSGLGKEFKLDQMRGQTSLREVVHQQLRTLARCIRAGARRDDPEVNGQPESFWALRDVSFEVRQGEALGIIGRNGAGKSTLLKILGRITAPTTGRAEIHGRVGSLLEVGTGFNPELTGRQNIFLNGSILGMNRREIARRFDEIVAFSEIEQFIDMPVKHYSSGMYMRLAFSVAAHLDTDVLLADEVLAVGDAAFTQKCMAKINDVTWKGRTVLFVSHNTAAINNLCNTGIVLENGRLIFAGEARDASQFYLDRSLSSNQVFSKNPAIFPLRSELPAQLIGIGLFDNRGIPTLAVQRSSEIEMRLKVLIQRPSRDYYAVIMLIDRLGNHVLWVTDEDLGPAVTSQLSAGMHEFSIRLPGNLLKPNSYKVNAALCLHPTGKIDRHDGLLEFEVIDHDSYRAMKQLYRSNAIVAPDVDWQLVVDDAQWLETHDMQP